VPKTTSIPRAVRGALEACLEAVVDRASSSGPPPLYLARDLLQALEDACGETRTDTGSLLDTLGVDELTDDKAVRRLERPLSRVGAYEGGRWSYPDADALLGLMESTYRIEWVDPVEGAPPPTAPPPGVEVKAYDPDRPIASGDWIAHPKLGVAEVIEARGDRIRARFADRERTLLHRAVVSRAPVEAPSPAIAAAHALLAERLPSVVTEWRGLGHDPRHTFEAACVGKPGLHPRVVAERCIALVEQAFGTRLTLRSRAYDDEHGWLQRVPTQRLHEHYVSPAGVIAVAASQAVAPKDSDDDVLPGLEHEIARRLATLAATGA
jgi:hypothetical protein